MATQPMTAQPMPSYPTGPVVEERQGILGRQGRIGQALGLRPRPAEGTPVNAPKVMTPSTAEPPLPPAQTAPPPLAPEGPPQTSDATVWPPAYRTGPVTPAPANATYRSRPLANMVPPRPAFAEERPAAPRPAPKAAPPALQPTSAPALLPQPVAPAVVREEAPRAEPAKVTPAAPEAAPAPIRLTEKELVKRVQDACGKLARNVTVEQGKDRTVLVHVYAVPATEHLLVARLLKVPELAARNVALHVHLAN
jgi:hypothetical protein